jgi:mannose-6-phosphate isomerase
MRMTEAWKAVDGPEPGEARISPFLLQPRFVHRVWGRKSLEPWYADTGTDEAVGEVWMTGAECVAATGPHRGAALADLAKQFPGQLGNGEYPLLVKMLFPDDKLSVQVHPNDEQAQKLGLRRGKTECWYVLEAEPGAHVMLGLKHGVGVEDLREGAADGSAEDLLQTLAVEAGDMVFVDAGTVHAIGPGVTILEVQQTCDITYRLWDYGRPRELHLDDGLAVVKLQTAAGKIKPRENPGFTRLIETEYFVVDRVELQAGEALEMPMDGIGCVVGLRGEAAVNEVEFATGQAVVVPEGSVMMSSRQGATVLRCWEPGE